MRHLLATILLIAGPELSPVSNYGSGHSTTQRYTTTENYRGPDTRPDYLR